MSIKEAMQKAVTEGNATLAGRICDKMRFELGATYTDIETRFVANTGCTASDFEAQHTWESCPENKPNKAQQWYGAYDEGGNLRATFDSPSEAYHYTQSRGHMHGGSDKPIVNHADKLAEALRAWEYAGNEGGISMVDWFQVAREKTRAALAAYEQEKGGQQ